jgi:hypothetical protein
LLTPRDCIIKSGHRSTQATQEVRNMRDAPVGEDELTRAKALLLRQIPLSESDISSIARDFLARRPEPAAGRADGSGAPLYDSVAEGCSGCFSEMDAPGKSGARSAGASLGRHSGSSK